MSRLEIKNIMRCLVEQLLNIVCASLSLTKKLFIYVSRDVTIDPFFVVTFRIDLLVKLKNICNNLTPNGNLCNLMTVVFYHLKWIQLQLVICNVNSLFKTTANKHVYAFIKIAV